MTLTPVLATDRVTWTLMRRAARLRRRPVGRYREHIVVLGCGRHMTRIIKQLVEAGRTVVVVDDDAVAVEQAKQAGAVALRGDGADLRMLRLSQARYANLVLSTMRRLEDNLRVLEHVRGPRVLVRVFSDIDGRRINAMGGLAIVEANAGAAQFHTWFHNNFVPDPHVAGR
jgi:Trk K+ transport system NAD-binding subunit